MVTALFGEKKFGTFKFGPTTQTRLRFGLEVDWMNKSLFTGENEAKYLQDLSTERGRQYTISANGQNFEHEDTGKFSAVLLDEQRRFDPYNEDSPLFGKLGGGKYFRVKVRTIANHHYPLMAGMIDEPVNFTENGIDKVRFEGTDGWAFLRNQNKEVTVPLQEGIYVEEAIKMVLAAAEWPRIWGHDLGEGVDQRPYFWVDERSAAQVIHEVVHGELGTVSIAADGKMRFRSRLANEEEGLTLTDDDVRINGFRRMSPAEVIRNVVRVESSPRTEGSVQTVWEIPKRLQINAGQTISDIFTPFTYNNESVPVKNPISPVSGSDFDASQNEDGSGSDYTGNISVSMHAFSTTSVLSITNSGGTTAWVYVRVRGTPITKGNTVSFGFRDKESIKQFGPRPFVFTIDQSVNVARQYRDLLESYLTVAKNFLVVDLVPDGERQFTFDLGKIVSGQFDDFGIYQAFRVIRVKHQFIDRAGMSVNTRLWLEPYVRLFTGVQLPVQLPFQLGSV